MTKIVVDVDNLIHIFDQNDLQQKKVEQILKICMAKFDFAFYNDIKDLSWRYVERLQKSCCHANKTFARAVHYKIKQTQTTIAQSKEQIIEKVRNSIVTSFIAPSSGVTKFSDNFSG